MRRVLVCAALFSSTRAFPANQYRLFSPAYAPCPEGYGVIQTAAECEAARADEFPTAGGAAFNNWGASGTAAWPGGCFYNSQQAYFNAKLTSRGSLTAYADGPFRLCVRVTRAEVDVAPPPASCASVWSSNAVCNPLQTAVSAAAFYTTINVASGTYFNQGWTGSTPQVAAGLDNNALLKIENTVGLTLRAAPGALTMPKLAFDGSAAVSIKNSHWVTVAGIEIEGAARRITGAEASLNRRRLAGKDLPSGATTGACGEMECGSCATAPACTGATHCEWNAAGARCGAAQLSYFQGSGITVWAGQLDSSRLVFVNNTVHACPGSGIRSNKADYVLIKDNVVYDNTWWTTSASSGVVLAECAGSGFNAIEGNAVYGNRNFLPFFYDDLSSLPGAHSAADGCVLSVSGVLSLAWRLLL